MIIKVIFLRKTFLLHNNFNNNFFLEIQTFLGLQALPYLFPVKTLKRKLKNNGTPIQRSTRASAAANFFKLFDTQPAADEFLDKNPIPTPFSYGIGNLDNFENIIIVVVVNQIRYLFPNFKSGFEFSFKIFFALDMEYPNLTTEFWVLIQQIVFELYSKSDKKAEVARSVSLRKEILNILKVDNNNEHDDIDMFSMSNTINEFEII